MRCPGCQYMCSDLRDLCPKCLLDLRPHKRAVGLAVTNPDFTYPQLLQKHAQKSTPIKAHSPPGAISGISQLLRGLWNEVEVPPASKISEARESAAPGGAGAAHSPIVARQTLSEPSSHLAAPHADAPQIKPAGLDDVFAQARQELRGRISEMGASLYLEQIAAAPNPQQVELFFGLCADALRDPGVEEIYQDQITTSESRSVKSEALTAQLSKVEKLLSSSVFSLRSRSAPSLGAQQVEAGNAQAHQAAPSLKVAPLMLRLRSFLLDAALVIFLGALSGLTYFTLNELKWLQLADASNVSILIAPLTLTALISIAGATIYPLVSFSFFGTTFGLGACGLRVLNRNRAELGRENAWLRSIILPVSLLAFGWLPLLFGGISLHDWLAKTEVYLDPDEV